MSTYINFGRQIIRWCRHYIYFSKAASFLTGLVFAHGLVKNAVVDVLMMYLTQDWEHPSLMKAAAVVNIEEAISGVIALIIALVTDARVGRFKMVVYTTASFILGLLLLWFSTWLLPVKMKGPIFYIALLLVSFGKAGKDPPFKDFIGDQLSGKDEEQVYDRATFWWRVCKFTGAAVSVFFLTNKTWKDTFLICAAVMGATYLIFLAGTCCPYNYELAPGNPFSVLIKVLKASFAKRQLNYPRTPSGYFRNTRNELPLFPREPFFRCVDKAAIVEETSPRPELEAELPEENLCTVEEVRQAKSLLRLMPLWCAFMLYCIVTAAGNTFFIEQSSGLDERVGNNFRLPINFFFILSSFMSSITSFLAKSAGSKFFSRTKKAQLWGGVIRVGLGLVASVVCCDVAAQFERARLHRVEIYGNPDTEDVILPMSILRLTPQYILLGVMGGLAEDGLTELYYLLVHDSMRGIETPMNQLMLGVGKTLSVACVFVFKSWFGDTINTSRLDKYFGMLYVLSLVNLVFYFLIGIYYVRTLYTEIEFESSSAQQEVVEQQELEPALEFGLEQVPEQEPALEFGPEQVPEQEQQVQEHGQADVGVGTGQDIQQEPK